MNAISCKYNTVEILSAAVSNESEILFYLDFFRKISASANDIYTLFVENGAEIEYYTGRSILLTVNDDVWMVELNPADEPVLYHNNYVVNEDLSRSFTQGFHRQETYGIHDFGVFVRKMCAYSWAEHQDYLRAYNDNLRSVRLHTLLALADNYAEEPSSGKYCCYTFVCYDDSYIKMAKELHLKLEILEKYPPQSSGFSVCGCRVFRSQEKLFPELMNLLKKNCPEELVQDYINLCEETIPQLA